jgi:hypothetical protein
MTGASQPSAESIIRALGLKPHPKEGGWFVETYRSSEGVENTHLPKRYSAFRAFGTAIFYLLTPDTKSELHSLASDEVFHFYLGDPVVMVHLPADGKGHVFTLGHDIAAGQLVQVVVPRGTWQGAYLKEGGAWALLGCSVCPGFDYRDYESASRTFLVERYPNFREIIERLTHE